MRSRVGSLVISAALAGSATAAESTLTLDPTASRITFTLKATLHQVDGSFDLTSGEIRFDPETGAASGRVVVDARSGDTEKAKRDKKMHETVLKSVEHPLIVFEPTSFEGTLSPRGSSELQVEGTMQLLGAKHTMAFPLEVSIEHGEVRVRGSFAVPYVEWGLTDPSAFVLRVAKTVDVSLELAGRVKAAPDE